MSSSAGEWLGLVAGAALIVQGLVFLVRPRLASYTAGRADMARALVGAGILIATTDADHLRGWSLTGRTVVFFCTVPVAIATAVFVVRSLRAQRAARRQDGGRDPETPAVP